MAKVNSIKYLYNRQDFNIKQDNGKRQTIYFYWPKLYNNNNKINASLTVVGFVENIKVNIVGGTFLQPYIHLCNIQEKYKTRKHKLNLNSFFFTKTFNKIACIKCIVLYINTANIGRTKNISGMMKILVGFFGTFRNLFYCMINFLNTKHQHCNYFEYHAVSKHIAYKYSDVSNVRLNRLNPRVANIFLT